MSDELEAMMALADDALDHADYCRNKLGELEITREEALAANVKQLAYKLRFEQEARQQAHAAGAAEERARIVALLEQAIKDTQERCRKLSETDEYPSVLGELDGLRRFSGKVRQP